MSWDEKKVIINDNCIWCWACVAICPEIFDMNDEAKAIVKTDADFANSDCLDDAIGTCPVEAIEKI